MKKRIILLLSLLCSLVFQAQTWTWDSLVNPFNSEILRKDVNQNVYAFSRRDTVLSKYTGKTLEVCEAVRFTIIMPLRTEMN